MQQPSGSALMFHSIGQTPSAWIRRYLTCNLEQFEVLVKHISRKYNALSIDEWVEKGEARDRRDVLLTFDDGYLDNWSLALPILEKYKVGGTVFVNPEFVDKEAVETRPQYRDLAKDWAKVYRANSLGYMNEAELKACDSSGYLAVESHSMSHNFVFTSNKIIDFYDGQAEYDWLFWLLYPTEKPNYINEDLRSRIPKGFPIFTNDRALRVRKFNPSDALLEFCKVNYTHNGKQNLLKILADWDSEAKGSFETIQEQRNRYEYELFSSKSYLQDLLGRSVEFLCWPGGGYNDLSMDLAIKAGYKATTYSHKNLVTEGKPRIDSIKRGGYGSFYQAGGKWKETNYRTHLLDLFEGRQGKLTNRVRAKLYRVLS